MGKPEPQLAPCFPETLGLSPSRNAQAQFGTAGWLRTGRLGLAPLPTPTPTLWQLQIVFPLEPGDAAS